MADFVGAVIGAFHTIHITDLCWSLPLWSLGILLRDAGRHGRHSRRCGRHTRARHSRVSSRIRLINRIGEILKAVAEFLAS
ncbi:hypothetical protein [Bifidobacterium vansinderenii]|uniref:Uncharacterized protein n=1 Tax=Bifidobacterium vansinderenii TaxID=1984871 RepID=A0A229VXF2_9BIFI|nr:hypothetical protein [Bifidobacterium vansinderenii]OXN00287.1 hypothetical protein Tam10B_1510 [Bifidobacterium vansinderenii]